MDQMVEALAVAAAAALAGTLASNARRRVQHRGPTESECSSGHDPTDDGDHEALNDAALLLGHRRPAGGRHVAPGARPPSLPRRRRRLLLHSADAVSLGEGRFRFDGLLARGVSSLEVSRATFPRAYTIHEGNCEFAFNETPFCIPHGEYTQTDLVELLGTLISASEPDARVMLDERCSRLRITAPCRFHLVFGSRSPKYELGFNCARSCSREQAEGLHVLHAPRRLDLSGARFLRVVVEEVEEEHTGCTFAMPFAASDLAVFDASVSAMGAPRRFRKRDLPRLTLRVTHRAGGGDEHPYDVQGLAWHLEVEAQLTGELRWECK
ncbi:MAG: hypothetical protein VYE81_03060 [Planctomycetota bacterium]|nr:hypothetical protein [Planctomycetota bacterium]